MRFSDIASTGLGLEKDEISFDVPARLDLLARVLVCLVVWQSRRLSLSIIAAHELDTAVHPGEVTVLWDLDHLEFWDRQLRVVHCSECRFSVTSIVRLGRRLRTPRSLTT
jgi:hypothetical protein